jgi:phytoene synthase
MQLTNILRDVGEDLQKNRIYLPADELKQFGLTEDDLFENMLSENFIEFMKFQIERARSYYQSADKGIPLLSKDSRLPVQLARENYSRILNKIEQNNYDVFSQRAYLNSTEKLTILPKVLYNLNKF